MNQYGFGFHGYQDGSTGYKNPVNTYVSGHFGIDMFTGGKNRLRISTVGNVGIGTNNPKAKLAVEGQIRAKSVKVMTNIAAPDYVFEPDYKLLSLKETKKYITKHKHLPEIPSAKEIKKNGLNIEEMNFHLLKKVEELTLHLIEKEEQIDMLTKRIEKLEKK